MRAAARAERSLRAELARERRAAICAFTQLLDLKDLGTGVHSTRLAEWGVRLGRELGLREDRLHDLEVAAALHDVGKVGVPDAILKKPGPLTPEERTEMQKHSEYGWQVLHRMPGFERASLFVLHHHEAYDGRGYPAGLKGDEIPVEARIVAIIDAFDAMISSRPYRNGLPVSEAIARLERAASAQFDPVLTPAFIRIATTEAASVFEVAGRES
jgi:HD-GYP domain-containing protein (c-di-GMP phosphodiesterase class II)